MQAEKEKFHHLWNLRHSLLKLRPGKIFYLALCALAWIVKERNWVGVHDGSHQGSALRKPHCKWPRRKKSDSKVEVKRRATVHSQSLIRTVGVSGVDSLTPFALNCVSTMWHTLSEWYSSIIPVLSRQRHRFFNCLVTSTATEYSKGHHCTSVLKQSVGWEGD